MTDATTIIGAIEAARDALAHVHYATLSFCEEAASVVAMVADRFGAAQTVYFYGPDETRNHATVIVVAAMTFGGLHVTVGAARRLATDEEIEANR